VESSPGDADTALKRLRNRAQDVADRAGDWFEVRRAEQPPWDLAGLFYERDREAFASVLGAAIALRLFVLVVSVALLAAGAIVTVLGVDAVDGLLDTANVGGSVAEQIADATTRSSTTGVFLVLLGLWLTLTTGRSFTKVLAACSAAAWGLRGRDVRTTLRMATSVVVLIALLLAVGGVLNRIRDIGGVTLGTMSWFATAAVVFTAWFAVTWTLPRRSHDPGALLPGALVVAVAITGLQFFMQFYLPSRIARSSEVMGSLGFSVAMLGYMFLMGRLMAAGLVLNAVVFERFGSVSAWFFSVPGLRRLPARSTRLREFFELDPPPGGPEDPDSPEDPGSRV
jgi:uncharacterized BrkB/YihY/UPF0761 family membrane protein